MAITLNLDINLATDKALLSGRALNATIANVKNCKKNATPQFGCGVADS
jgi:hypothetical protein